MSTHTGTPVVKRLARTYDGNTDAWERVLHFQEVTDYAAAHPDKGSQAIATALDLPRSRIRPWLSDSQPDPVRAVERARDIGWLDLDDPAIESSAAVLVAWIFAGGSIDATNYRPRFSATDQLGRDILETAADNLGIELRSVDRDHPKRGDEFEPVEDVTLLGRYLAALGAPVGAKGPETPLSLPKWLDDAADESQLAFARTYVLNRGTLVPDKPSHPVTLREERTPAYQRGLRTFLRRFVEDPDSITADGPHTRLGPQAAARLAAPPIVDGIIERGIWPLAALTELLQDLTPAQALDCWGVYGFGYSQREWARIRGVGDQATSNTMAQVDDRLGPISRVDVLPTPSDALAMVVLTSLCRAGLTPGQAIDYYIAGGEGRPTYREWADTKGVSLQAVRQSVSGAIDSLDG